MDNSGLNKISAQILDAAIEVHKEMGPGLLETVYEYCLVEELKTRNIKSVRQVYLPLVYKGKKLNKEFRIDIMVMNEIPIEIKAVDFVIPVHEAQIISYLKLSDKRLGFLINFNVPLLKDGFRRFVNNF